MKASTRPEPVGRRASGTSTPGVDGFMANLEHPNKPEIEALRQIIRGADSTIEEGVKWNAPSFRTTEFFATTNLRTKGGVGIIFHLGAKVRDIATLPIEDPKNLLTWLGKDRAITTFADMKDVRDQRAALEDIVRQWIKYV